MPHHPRQTAHQWKKKAHRPTEWNLLGDWWCVYLVLVGETEATCAEPAFQGGGVCGCCCHSHLGHDIIKTITVVKGVAALAHHRFLVHIAHRETCQVGIEGPPISSTPLTLHLPSTPQFAMPRGVGDRPGPWRNGCPCSCKKSCIPKSHLSRFLLVASIVVVVSGEK